MHKSYTVTLFRSNGRVVRKVKRSSKYSAKQLRDAWEENHDDGYYVTIEKDGQ